MTAFAERYDVVRVAGPEAESYLQGQLSQDVVALPVGAVGSSFLLEPNGKVCAWLWVHRDAADRFSLWVDTGFGSLVVERLKRFKLRTKVDIELADPAEVAVGPDTFTVPSEEERIATGLPRMGAELEPGATIPAEAGPAVIERSVSFTKGCYTGQELVARIDSRGGNVPRQVRGVEVGDGAQPPVGAEVVVDGRVVGRLTSVAWSPEREAAIALASVARSVEPPATAELRWDGGRAPAEIRALPR